MKKVFGLIDPKTDRVVYVGTTESDYTADEWLGFLIRVNRDKDPRGEWKRLLQDEPRPNAVLLEQTDDPKAKNRWIDLLLNAGHKLVDSMSKPLYGQ